MGRVELCSATPGGRKKKVSGRRKKLFLKKVVYQRGSERIWAGWGKAGVHEEGARINISHLGDFLGLVRMDRWGNGGLVQQVTGLERS